MANTSVDSSREALENVPLNYTPKTHASSPAPRAVRPLSQGLELVAVGGEKEVLEEELETEQAHVQALKREKVVLMAQLAQQQALVIRLEKSLAEVDKEANDSLQKAKEREE